MYAQFFSSLTRTVLYIAATSNKSLLSVFLQKKIFHCSYPLGVNCTATTEYSAYFWSYSTFVKSSEFFCESNDRQEKLAKEL